MDGPSPGGSRARPRGVGVVTVGRILKTRGLQPVPGRPTSWQSFLRAHKDAIAGADCFTTEVWTWRGLVTVYTVLVIHRASRRVQILGSTPHPDEAFMRQIGRTLTMATPSPAAPSLVIGTRNGAHRSVSVCVRQESGSCRQPAEESVNGSPGSRSGEVGGAGCTPSLCVFAPPAPHFTASQPIPGARLLVLTRWEERKEDRCNLANGRLSS